MTETQQKLLELNNVFSPSAPIEHRDLFFGRLEQVDRTLEAINERGQHAIIYGERGVGKTSLANIINLSLQRSTSSIKVTCNPNDTFKSIWSRALSKLQFNKLSHGIGFHPELKESSLQLNLFLPQYDDITAGDIQVILESLSENLIFIFDEFDSISDEEIKNQFAHSIKYFSDNVTYVTIILVGIADDITELITKHLSLERCLVNIPIPKMSIEELSKIVDHGFGKLGLRIENEVRQKIISYSAGFPHYTHLLSKYSAESTIRGNKILSDHLDFDYAVSKAIKNTQQKIRDEFQKAIISSKDIKQFENVLYAVAITEPDEFGCVNANQILKKYNDITSQEKSREGVTYYLSALSSSERGEILIKVGSSKNVKYKFSNSLMKTYVLLKHYEKKNLSNQK